MKKADKIAIAQSIVRAFYRLRATHYTTRLPTVDASHYATLDAVDGAVNVYRNDGKWLGWVNATGELMSTAHPDRNELGPTVVRVATAARVAA